MSIIISMLAALLMASVPFSVKAQEVDSYDNYKVACESGAECNDFNVNYDEAQSNDDIAQIRRTRTRRTRTRGSNNKKIYAGGTLGVFFPSEIDDLQIGIISGGTTDLQTVDPGAGFVEVSMVDISSANLLVLTLKFCIWWRCRSLRFFLYLLWVVC